MITLEQLRKVASSSASTDEMGQKLGFKDRKVVHYWLDKYRYKPVKVGYIKLVKKDN